VEIKVYSNKNIVINELIGLRVEVVSCKDKAQRGIRGKVVDETKNTFIVEAKNATKRVIKETAVFKFYAGKESFIVEGKEISFRPHERIEKALKYYKRRFDK
jgi:ribonuclease P protein subunit POP4